MRRILFFAWLLLVAAQAADAQQIGFVTTLQDYWSCYLSDSNPATVHIIARREFSMQGVQGAEFRVDGFPTEPGSGYVVTAEPNPEATLVLGDPLHGGANIAFDECHSEENVLLYTVTVTHVSGEPRFFKAQVKQHSTPSNPYMACPLINDCDNPQYTAVCAYAGYTAPRPHSPVPSNPVPADGAEDVSITPELSAEYIGDIVCCEPVDAYPYKAIYFGTDPDPPLVEEAYPGTPPTSANPYQPGTLQPDTQYYWRVESAPWNACVTASGPVWTFHTTPSVAIEKVGWDTIKKRYRE
jgi:hypothetical protein